MTLSKNQKRYRVRKKKEQKDWHKVVKPDGKIGHKVSTKNLNVSVSLAAKEKLKTHAKDFGYTLSEMLSHIINTKTDSYAVTMGAHKTGDSYVWDEDLLKESRSGKRKRGKQEARLNLPVTSTAFYNLQCHANDKGFSKARLVEDFITYYKPITEEQKKRNQDYGDRMKQIAQDFKDRVSMVLSPEEIAEMQKAGEVSLGNGWRLVEKNNLFLLWKLRLTRPDTHSRNRSASYPPVLVEEKAI